MLSSKPIQVLQNYEAVARRDELEFKREQPEKNHGSDARAGAVDEESKFFAADARSVGYGQERRAYDESVAVIVEKNEKTGEEGRELGASTALHVNIQPYSYCTEAVTFVYNANHSRHKEREQKHAQIGIF